MSERLDALAVRESNGKSYYTKIGAAFPLKSGVGYTVIVEMMPAPNEGQFKILLMAPKPRDGQAPQQSRNDLNDDVPF